MNTPASRNQVIKARSPGHRTCFVKSVARDGGFAVTYSEQTARRFTRFGAAVAIVKITGNTRMQFDAEEVKS